MEKDWERESPPLEDSLDSLVGKIGVRVYESKDGFIRNALNRRIKIVAEINDDLEPHIDNRYICDTCGTVGQCHPVTDYCFICDTDNWRNIQGEFGI